MDITIRIKHKTLIASLAGELDHHSAKEVKNLIEEVIQNRGVAHLIFDFTALSFMDSSGIGVIVGRYKLVSAMGGKVAIVCNSRTIQRLLTMSGLKQLIATYNTLDEALLNLQEELA